MLSRSEFRELIQKISSLSIDERANCVITRQELEAINHAYHDRSTKALIAHLIKDTLVDLSHFKFSGQNLEGVCLKNINFQGANFAFCKLDVPITRLIIQRKYRLILDGVNFSFLNFNPILVKSRQVGEKLIFPTRFAGMNLDHSDFKYAKLVEAIFNKSSLRYSNFAHADLTGVVFEGADITGADFTHAKCNPLQFIFAKHCNKAKFSDPKFVEYIRTLKTQFELMAAAKNNFERRTLQFTFKHLDILKRFVPALLLNYLIPEEVIKLKLTQATPQVVSDITQNSELKSFTHMIENAKNVTAGARAHVTEKKPANHLIEVN